jgi:hypothetical protein
MTQDAPQIHVPARPMTPEEADALIADIKAEVDTRLDGLTGEALTAERARLHAENVAMAPEIGAQAAYIARAHADPASIPALLDELRGSQAGAVRGDGALIQTLLDIQKYHAGATA